MKARSSFARSSFAPIALLALGSACSEEPAATADPQPPAAAADPGHQHDPAQRVDLGTGEIGGVLVHAFQVTTPVPGAEGDFDLEFAPGTLLPIVRGWVGEESGVGSRKARFQRETDTRMHGHPEIPDPLADGARFWLEIEVGGATAKGSFAIRR